MFERFHRVEGRARGRMKDQALASRLSGTLSACMAAM